VASGAGRRGGDRRHRRRDLGAAPPHPTGSVAGDATRAGQRRALTHAADAAPGGNPDPARDRDAAFAEQVSGEDVRTASVEATGPSGADPDVRPIVAPKLGDTLTDGP
jgi:hypothetical protein